MLAAAAVLVAAGSLAAASPAGRVPIAPRRHLSGRLADLLGRPARLLGPASTLPPSSASGRAGSTRTCSCARSSATTTLAAPPGGCSCPISPCASRLRRTAAGPIRSRSSAASGSGRRSTARSPQRTSSTRSSGSCGSGTAPCGRCLQRHQGVRRLPLGPGPVDLRHLDAERTGRSPSPSPGRSETSSTGSRCRRPRRSRLRWARASRAAGSSTERT